LEKPVAVAGDWTAVVGVFWLLLHVLGSMCLPGLGASLALHLAPTMQAEAVGGVLDVGVGFGCGNDLARGFVPAIRAFLSLGSWGGC